MSELTFRLIFLTVFLAIVIAFNYRVLTNPGFVDRPLDGWLGRVTNVKNEDKEKRLQAYRRMAKRNFIVIAILFLFWLKDIVALVQYTDPQN